MNSDLVEARLLLIRAEIHLEWLCKESRAARELVADIQKFLTLSDSFKDSCGGVDGHAPYTGKPLSKDAALVVMAGNDSGRAAQSPIGDICPSGYQAPPAGIDTASENEDAGAGAEASSAPEQNGAVTDPGFLIARTPFAAREDRNKPPSPPVGEVVKVAESFSADLERSVGVAPVRMESQKPSKACGEKWELRDGESDVPARPSESPIISICNPERPSIVKARKV